MVLLKCCLKEKCVMIILYGKCKYIYDVEFFKCFWYGKRNVGGIGEFFFIFVFQGIYLQGDYYFVFGGLVSSSLQMIVYFFFYYGGVGIIVCYEDFGFVFFGVMFKDGDRCLCVNVKQMIGE